jgi:hypothetical protein
MIFELAGILLNCFELVVDARLSADARPRLPTSPQQKQAAGRWLNLFAAMGVDQFNVGLACFHLNGDFKLFWR